MTPFVAGARVRHVVLGWSDGTVVDRPWEYDQVPVERLGKVAFYYPKNLRLVEEQ